MSQPKAQSRPIRDAIPPKIAAWIDEKLQAVQADFAAGKHQDAHEKIKALEASMRACHYYDDGTILCG